jgi:hypothetical protein
MDLLYLSCQQLATNISVSLGNGNGKLQNNKKSSFLRNLMHEVHAFSPEIVGKATRVGEFLIFGRKVCCFGAFML